MGPSGFSIFKSLEIFRIWCLKARLVSFDEAKNKVDDSQSYTIFRVILSYVSSLFLLV